MEREHAAEIKDNMSKYAYSFDFDVMHHYMIKALSPFFLGGNVLEAGCFKGDFTVRLQNFFEDISCVEVSEEAISIARKKVNSNVKFYHSLFEDVKLPCKYDNVILTHVLEHMDEPVLLLRKIRNEWIEDKGRLLIVCPNANAPSRQIAVKMGLISHNAAVTESEFLHGHRVTYSLDTLERDIKLAGLRIIYRSGVFFKAMANFQWDKLMKSDIISKEYLDGCYELGQQYPDLCSSIYFICEK